MFTPVQDFLPYYRKPVVGLTLGSEAAIHGGPQAAHTLVRRAIESWGVAGGVCTIRLIGEVPNHIHNRVEAEFGVPFSGSDEAYVLEAGAEVSIYALSDRGLLYGTTALLRLLDGSRITACLAYGSPVCAMRGIKIYLPAPEDVEYFKRIIDMAAYYKYNTVVIEVGGAMEYRSHPEVNEGWVAYCADMNRYSDRSKEIQERTFGWKKNSIHAENGGGRVLRQETVASLVAYCREKMMDVIPEMPSLSHCDYLLTAHPEIREREEDPYPDTYCPSNPGSYRLLFDMLDEVIAVFQPGTLHIGHDEYYSIGLCPLCRDLDAAEIYAGDIWMIHDHLADRGIRTMIWGDKLLDAYLDGYGSCGGATVPMYHPHTGECSGVIPATHRAIDLVPRDLAIMHWYWGVDNRLEQQFHSRGLDTVFGNFSGPEITNWDGRLVKGIQGAVISNWSALKRDNLQRNCFFYNLAYTSLLFWSPADGDDRFDSRNNAALQELMQYRVVQECLSGTLPAGTDALLDILHTTDLDQPYSDFVDGTFVDRGKDTLGHYVLTYKDGTEGKIPIVYGHNISGQCASWERSLQSDTTVWRTDRRLQEAAYTTCPVQLGSKTWYRYICQNPRPGVGLAGIRIEPARADCKVLLQSLSVTDAARLQ